MAINKRKILESAQKHLQKGLIDKALEDYRTVLRADPRDSNVLIKVGDLYLKQGKREDSINAYLRVAQQFTKEGFDAKAVALYKQISRLDPKRNDVCVPLAELYSRMGLIGDAIASLQTAADAAYRAGNKDEALELLRRMAALDPSNTPNRLKVAELLAQEGRTTEALVEYDAVAEELERRGEVEERIRVLERILAADPERATALREVARAKLATSQFAAAQQLAEQLIASHADDVDGYEMLGHALLGAGESERAHEVFRDLAERFRLRGDEDRARDLMQRFGGAEALSVEETEAPLDPGGGMLELDSELGSEDFLLDEGLAAEAPPPAAPPAAPTGTPIGKIEPVQVLAPKPQQASVVQTPETTDPEQLLAEATVYLRYGKHERAVGALRKILAGEPDHRAALEQLGEALAAQGDTANAATAWQRAAEAARGAGDAEDFERLRARLAELDAEAAAALAGPAMPAPTEAVVLESSEGVAPAPIEAVASAPDEPATDEVDVDLDFDLDLPDAGPEASVEADAAGETPELEVPEIEFSDELDDLEQTPNEAPLGEAPDADALAEPQDAAAAATTEPEEDPTATTPAQLAEQLEEAEFYLEQGLLDEARDLYERILASAPSHPQAMLRLGEIAARSGQPMAPSETTQEASERARETAAAVDDSGDDTGLEWSEEFEDAAPAPEPPAPEPVASAPDVPAPEPVAAAPEPGAIETDQDTGDFDLAAELSFGIGTDEPVGGTLAGTEEEGFEQVFNAFKSGVERELGEGDHEARYDLGIAYKEMGLLDDAIGEFRIAMQVDGRRLSCLHMMGLCALELGRGADAVAHLEQALSLPDLPDDQCVPLRYDLGRAYAARGDVERARAAFEQVRSVDPDFGDVDRELAALDTHGEGAASADEDDDAEAYESFDDLLAERPDEPATPRYESFDDFLAETADEPEPEPEPATAAPASDATESAEEATPAVAAPSFDEDAAELEPAEPALAPEPEAAAEPLVDEEPLEPAASEPVEPADSEPVEPAASEPVEPEASEPVEPAASEPPAAASEEPAEPAPKRKRRKISFV